MIVKCEIRPWTTREWVSDMKNELGIEFREIFGVILPDFISPLYGFNSVRFTDDVLRPPADKSGEDVVLERYGQRAGHLIKKLISGPPRPEPIKTWVDMGFDIDAVASTTGFERCEYSFIATHNGVFSGSGYYKLGLIVHRPNDHLEKPYPQYKDGRWAISTIQGVLLSQGKNLTFNQAKRIASQFACAFDFEVAQTMALTDAQVEAAKRVFYHVYRGGKDD